MPFDDHSPEVESIAAQLRSSIRQARVPGIRPARRDAAPIADQDDNIAPDLMLLRSGCGIAHAPFRSHRRVLGRCIIFIRNLARELLVQLLERQDSFNAAAARAIGHLSRKLDRIELQQQRIEQRVAALEAGGGERMREARMIAPVGRNGGLPQGLDDRVAALERAMDAPSERRG